VNEVRERRRAHELNDNVHLLWDPEQQSRQQNWIEFQDYHLKLHEWQKKKRDGLQKDLNDTQKEVSDTGMKGSERASSPLNPLAPSVPSSNPQSPTIRRCYPRRDHVVIFLDARPPAALDGQGNEDVRDWKMREKSIPHV